MSILDLVDDILDCSIWEIIAEAIELLNVLDAYGRGEL